MHAGRRSYGPRWFPPVVAAILVVRALVLGLGALAADASAHRPVVPLIAASASLGDAGMPALLRAWSEWDAFWYQSIALDGYTEPGANGQGSIAFFPAYPFAMRGLAAVFSAAPTPEAVLWAGFIVSNLAFAAALVLLHRLLTRYLLTPAAHDALWLLALFPGSIFFSAVYPESLFLLLTAGVFLACAGGRWAWAAVLAGLAGALRLQGVALGAAVVVAYAASIGWNPRRLTRAAGWMPLAFGGAALFFAFLWLSEGISPAGYLAVQNAGWNGDRLNQALYILSTVWWGTTTPTDAVYLFNLLLVPVTLMLSAAALVWRRGGLPPVWGVWALAAALMSALSWISTMRFTAVLFPIFALLAAGLPRPARWGLCAGFALGQVCTTLLLASGAWVA